MKELEGFIAVFIILLGVRSNYSLIPPFNFISNVLSSLKTSFDSQSIPIRLTFVEMAALNGYRAETHEVITEDGYILTLYRLRGNGSGLPVLLHHGILDSADTWIIRGKTSLSITLANANYDVWLANARGSKYSLRHVSLNANVDPAYWNFSFDEHGLYDLPANIDYILNKTGAPKLNMFGHSQGNLMIWVLLSTRTEYNDKINVATALAPICYLQHVLPTIGPLFRKLPPLYPLFQAEGVTSVLADNSDGAILFRQIAQIPRLGYLIDAYGILFDVFGEDSTELEPSFLPTVTLHVPSGTSIKNFVHLGQVAVSGQFVRFDYGEVGNRLAYNSSTPPIYELGNIRAKVVLMAARNDKLSQLADVDTLRSQLPNVVQYIINERAMMNHLDYVWGRTATDYLYNYIFYVLKSYI